MPLLLTLTGNLLWEQTLELAGWEPGGTHRARSEFFQVGGKGINVTRVLARLGAETLALAFAGGETGEACRRWLRERAIPARLFSTVQATRAGFVVRTTGRPETTFFGRDVAPDAAAVAACALYLESCFETEAILAVSGSLPGWASPEFAPLREAVREFARRGRLWIDTYGPPLAEMVAWRPVAVKVNRDEFRGLTEGDLVATAARAGIAAWIVTDGAGAIEYVADGEHGTVEPPRVEVFSATGSGDAFFAGLLHARLHRGLTWRQAVEFGARLGAANAAHPRVAEFDPNF